MLVGIQIVQIRQDEPPSTNTKWVLIGARRSAARQPVEIDHPMAFRIAQHGLVVVGLKAERAETVVLMVELAIVGAIAMLVVLAADLLATAERPFRTVVPMTLIELEEPRTDQIGVAGAVVELHRR